MKIHPQVILKAGAPAFAVLPYDEYEAILERLEDVQDVEAIEIAQKNQEESFPLALVDELAQGKNPVKIFRNYRALTQADLAREVGISKQYISQIESGDRKGTLDVLQKIAKVLSVDLEDLI